MNDHVEIITPLQDHGFLESWYELSDASHFWFAWRMKAFLRQLDDLRIPVEAGWKVLDVGCGTGVLRQQVEAATNWVVDATDLDLNALRQAEAGRGRTLYYDITMRRDEFEQSYDALLLFDVLEHIEETSPFIEALLFHLKPGGLLFVNVPALQTLSSLYDQVAGHFRRYERRTLASEFKDFPLRIRDCRYWGITNVPILFLRKQWLALTARGKPVEQIIQTGFKPPGKFVNDAFLRLMNIETRLLPTPIAGASILMVAEKVPTS